MDLQDLKINWLSSYGEDLKLSKAEGNLLSQTILCGITKEFMSNGSPLRKDTSQDSRMSTKMEFPHLKDFKKQT